MTVPSNCANCDAPLPPDQPAGNRYCPKCTTAWQRGQPTREAGGVEDEATPAVAGRCANCEAPLPPDQPAGNRYCPRCAAAWQRGQAARE